MRLVALRRQVGLRRSSRPARDTDPLTGNRGTRSCNVALEAAAEARQALTVHQKAGRGHWR
jgi:hypothetical protein